jgi:hypothetical protein
VDASRLVGMGSESRFNLPSLENCSKAQALQAKYPGSERLVPDTTTEIEIEDSCRNSKELSDESFANGFGK